MAFCQTSQETRPRRIPRQDRAIMTVGSIMEAAAILFARDGFEKTSTTRIAELAGVSVGSLYEYFPNKDSLIASLVKNHCDQILSHIGQQLAGIKGQGAYRVMEVFIEATHESYASHIQLQRVLLEHIGRVSKPRHYKRVSYAIIDLLEAALDSSGEDLPRERMRQMLYVIECVVESLVQRSIVMDMDFFDRNLKEELLLLARAYLQVDYLQRGR